MNNAEARATAARIKPIAEAAGFVPKLNREEWLTQMALKIWPLIISHGGTQPAKWRVSVGFPKGAGGKRTAIGQHWHSERSADGSHEIFISPVLAEFDAADTLVHELVHTALPPGAGHKAPFVKLATAVGLVGKPTSCSAGEPLAAQLRAWIAEIGPYPHGALTPAERGPAPGSRLIKCECGSCGYVFRTTLKWLELGQPRCPNPARVPAYIMGREIGAGMVSLINKLNAKGIENLIERLNIWTSREVEKAVAKKQESKAAAIQDKTDCILFLIDSLQETDRTVPALIRLIEQLFADKSNAVVLSTIHKAKGLEAKRVFWINRGYKVWTAKQDWQAKQETNLCFVAASRAQEALYLLDISTPEAA